MKSKIARWRKTISSVALLTAILAAAARPQAAIEPFMNGIEENQYLPWYSTRTYQENGTTIPPADLPYGYFASKGANWAKIRCWVGNATSLLTPGTAFQEGNYANALANGLMAKAAGMKCMLQIFLCDHWEGYNSSVPVSTSNPAAGIFAGMTLAQKTVAVEQYCRNLVKLFECAGMKWDLYCIGNENDAGICAESLPNSYPVAPSVTIDAAEIWKAAQAGVRSVDPFAKFILHFARSWYTPSVEARVVALLDRGVQIDLVGLSYYPGMANHSDLTQWKNRVKNVFDNTNRSVVIMEWSYAYQPFPAGQNWVFLANNPLSDYSPLSVANQTNLIRDLVKWGQTGGERYGTYGPLAGHFYSGVLYVDTGPYGWLWWSLCAQVPNTTNTYSIQPAAESLRYGRRLDDACMSAAGLVPSTYDTNGPSQGVNGIPDAVEFALLQSVLEDQDHWANGPTLLAWRKNVRQIQIDLGIAALAPNNAEWSLLLAAYMTIGDSNSVAKVQAMLVAAGRPFTAVAYDTSQSTTFGPAADLDRDGISNLQEYTAVGGSRELYLLAAQAPDFASILSTLGFPLTSDLNYTSATVSFQPNGIPDADELNLLSYATITRWLFVQPYINAAWHVNAGRMYQDLQGSVVDARFQTYLAGLMTLGDRPSLDTVHAAVSLLTSGSVTIDENDYVTGYSVALAVNGDLDQDQRSNLTEFQAAGGVFSTYLVSAMQQDLAGTLTMLGLDPATIDINGPTTGSPNGIPDLYEMSLIQRIIESPPSSVQERVRAAWCHNMFQIIVDTFATPTWSGAWMPTLASLATLGDANSVAGVTGILGLLTPPGDITRYDTCLASLLGPLGDVDSDGRTNAVEFANSTGLADYLSRALDPLL